MALSNESKVNGDASVMVKMDDNFQRFLMIFFTKNELDELLRNPRDWSIPGKFEDDLKNPFSMARRMFNALRAQFEFYKYCIHEKMIFALFMQENFEQYWRLIDEYYHSKKGGGTLDSPDAFIIDDPNTKFIQNPVDEKEIKLNQLVHDVQKKFKAVNDIYQYTVKLQLTRSAIIEKALNIHDVQLFDSFEKKLTELKDSNDPDFQRRLADYDDLKEQYDLREIRKAKLEEVISRIPESENFGLIEKARLADTCNQLMTFNILSALYKDSEFYKENEKLHKKLDETPNSDKDARNAIINQMKELKKELTLQMQEINNDINKSTKHVDEVVQAENKKLSAAKGELNNSLERLGQETGHQLKGIDDIRANPELYQRLLTNKVINSPQASDLKESSPQKPEMNAVNKTVGFGRG